MRTEVEDALRIALRMLGASDKFRPEIVARLRQRGCQEAVISEVLNWLDRNKLADDRKTAGAFVKRLCERRHLGREMIRCELTRRGVSCEIIEEVVAQLCEEGEIARARDYLRKKAFRASSGASAYRSLLAKGFVEETARTAVEECLQEGELRGEDTFLDEP